MNRRSLLKGLGAALAASVAPGALVGAVGAVAGPGAASETGFPWAMMSMGPKPDLMYCGAAFWRLFNEALAAERAGCVRAVRHRPWKHITGIDLSGLSSS